jgi:hypothetical protein
MAHGFVHKLVEKAKEDPLKAVSAVASTTGLGLASANLITNRKRVSDANKNQQEQLRAMNRLTSALTNVNSTMKGEEEPVSKPKPEKESKMKKFRSKYFSVENGGYEGGKRKTAEISAGWVAAGAVAGGAGGAAVSHQRGGVSAGLVAIGAVLGAGASALLQWMYKVVDNSEFNAPESRLSTIHLIKVIESYYHKPATDEEREVEVTSPTRTEFRSSSHNYGGGHYGGYTNPDSSYNTSNSNYWGDSYTNSNTTTSGGITTKKKVTVHKKERYVVPYCIDGKPDSFTVNITLRFGVLVMLISNPVRQELQIINQGLDEYCHYFKNANYTSKTLCKNTYLVELQVVGENDYRYLYSLVNKVIAPMLWGGIKVNFVTDNALLSKGGAKFKRKDFSLSDDMVKGAGIGGAAGTLSGIVSRAAGSGTGLAGTLIYTAAGSIIGAALGALHHVFKKGVDRSNRQATVDARLMNSVVDDLKATGFKEGINFTRDPKTADDLKVRVSIVISKVSGELNLIINMIADDKLKDLTKDMITRIPNTSAVTSKIEDKYNEITITSISDNSANAGLIAGICNYFIRNKYPVYLVEVG